MIPDNPSSPLPPITDAASAVNSLYTLPAAPMRVLDAFLRNSADPIFVVDRAGRYVYVGDAGATAFGRDAAEMLGKTNAELGFSPEIAAELAAQTEEVFRTKKPVSGTSVVPTTAGPRIYEHNFSPVFDDIGGVAAMLCVARDVTEREKREAELRESEHRHRVSLSAGGMDGWQIDVATRSITAGTNLRKLLGFADGEYDGTIDSFSKYVYPDDRRTFCEALASTLQTGADLYMEYRIVLNDGRLRWIASQGEMLRDAERRFTRVCGVSWDVSKRKEAEFEQVRLAALVESSNDAIMSTTVDGIFASWNPAAERMFGYTSAEIIGKSFACLYPPGREQETMRLIDPLMHGKPIQHFETVRLCKDGTLIDVSLTLSLIRDRNGKVIGLSAIARDIRQQKEYEQERRYVMSKARCLLWYADVRVKDDSDVLCWESHFVDEEAAQEFMPIAINPGEPYHSARYRAHLPEDRERCDRLGDAAIRAGLSFTQEFRCRLADGTVRWMHEDIQVETIEKGKRWRVVGVCTDIDALKQVESALREIQERLQAALHAGKMGTWEWDMVANVLKWSAETESLFGFEPGTFEGSYEAYQKLLHPEDRPVVWNAVTRAIENNTSFEYDHRINLPDGGLRWLSGKGAAFYNAQGTPIRLLGTVADITDRKRLEAQFLQAQKMEGIGRLAGGIAHDFNNLLSVILGYAEIAEGDLKDDAQVLPNIRNIQNAAKRAARLTAQLLAFARRQVSAARIISPNEVVAGMNLILKPLTRENIELNSLLRPTTGRIKADPTQLEQVIVNLVVNASDAIPGAGKIVIETDNVTLSEFLVFESSSVPPGAYVQIAVSDTGVGMTDEVKTRLFEPFFTTKPPGKGTGLGLATVYGIVKQNGGHITVESQPGIGTVIQVYLPRVDGAADRLPFEAPRTLELRGTEIVLVVEDEQLVRSLTVNTLRRNGYTVMEAENGVQAIRAAQECAQDIHLLVTDAIMPEMGGKELTTRMKTLRPSTKVLYVSGYTEEVTLAHGILPDDTAFLQKPFSARDLLTKVRDVLNATD